MRCFMKSDLRLDYRLLATRFNPSIAALVRLRVKVRFCVALGRCGVLRQHAFNCALVVRIEGVFNAFFFKLRPICTVPRQRMPCNAL